MEVSLLLRLYGISPKIPRCSESGVQYQLICLFRGCRIRMAIFATIEWADLRSALTTTIDICVKHKVPGVKKIFIDPYSLPKEMLPSDAEITNSRAVDGELFELVDTLAQSDKKQLQATAIGSHPKILAAGALALRNYGIGPCSARWYYGSFDVFVRLEQRLASLYPSLIQHSGRCRGMSSFLL